MVKAKNKKGPAQKCLSTRVRPITPLRHEKNCLAPDNGIQVQKLLEKNPEGGKRRIERAPREKKIPKSGIRVSKGTKGLGGGSLLRDGERIANWAKHQKKKTHT